MLQEFKAQNWTDVEDMPAGGEVRGVGLSIMWQKGPLGEEGVDRLEPNGAFVETVIAAVIQRLEWYQDVRDGKFRCDENKFAISSLEEALEVLNQRTKDRQQRGVEGTHKV